MEYLLLTKCPLCRKIEKFIKINNKINNDNICCICLEKYYDNICKCKNCNNIFHIDCMQNIYDYSINNINSEDNIQIIQFTFIQSDINYIIYNYKHYLYDCIYIIYHCILLFIIIFDIFYLYNILHFFYCNLITI